MVEVLEPLALGHPGPHAPVGHDVHVEEAAGQLAVPARVDQQLRRPDDAFPAHLLVDGHLDPGPLCALNELDRRFQRLPSGFWQSACRPASKTFDAISNCAFGVTAMSTTSTLGSIEQLVDGSVCRRDVPFARRLLGCLQIRVCDRDDVEPGFAIGRQVARVDDRAGADDSDPVVERLRELRPLVELEDLVDRHRAGAPGRISSVRAAASPSASSTLFAPVCTSSISSLRISLIASYSGDRMAGPTSSRRAEPAPRPRSRPTHPHLRINRC